MAAVYGEDRANTILGAHEAGSEAPPEDRKEDENNNREGVNHGKDIPADEAFDRCFAFAMANS